MGVAEGGLGVPVRVAVLVPPTVAVLVAVFATVGFGVFVGVRLGLGVLVGTTAVLVGEEPVLSSVSRPHGNPFWQNSP